MADPWGVHDVTGGKAPSKAPVPADVVKAARAKLPLGPQLKPAQPERAPSYTGPEAHAPVPYGQPGYKPVATGAPRHLVAPKPPSPADLTFQNEVKAIGPAVVKQASNPRVAALQNVLGAATGIPQVANAIGSGHHLGEAAVSAAGLLPIGRLGKLGEVLAEGAKAADEVKAARTSEEAAQHVAQASKAAKDSGYGLRPPPPPKIPKGITTPETGGELGATVRKALQGGPAAGTPGTARGARSLRAEQEALRSTERTERVGKASEAMQQIGGLEGHQAALEALRGELPKVHFAGFKNLDEPTILAMVNHAQQHPDLLPFQKIRTVGAIMKAAAGQVPTRSEQTLLQHAFGLQAAGDLTRASGWRDKVGRSLAELVNLPRALEASFDLSAPFRQGLVAGVSHPVIFSRNLLPMVKAFGSDKVYDGLMTGIRDRPTFPLMDKAGLAITDVHSHALAGREEAFMSRLIGKVPGLRGSERAYTGFLNKTRADIFDHLAQQAAEQGHDLENPKTAHDIARFVNAATGRGDLGKLAPAAVVLNSTLFSPRLLASRLNFLNPVWYASLDPFARAQALKAAAGLVLTMGSVLSIARAAGAKVNTDPTNADFGKIRIGNTRVDIAAGFQQPIRLLAQEASGRITSSTTGKTLTLGPSGPGHLSRWDIAERFGISKLAPVPSIGSDLLHGQNFIGQPITAKGEASSHLIPLLWQDIYDLYNNGGIPAVGAGIVPGLFGVGLQTYKPKTPSGGGSSGSDPWGAGGGAVSSDPWSAAP